VKVTEVFKPKANVRQRALFGGVRDPLRDFVSNRRHEVPGVLLVNLVASRLEFPRIILASSRGQIVVVTNCSMAIKANRQCIVYISARAIDVM
jgi:hypothetical protein